MALSTYDELKTAVQTWMLRNDARIADNAGDLIALCEARLNRKLKLRVQWTDSTLTGTISSRSLTLPSDYVEPFGLCLTTYSTEKWLTPFLGAAGPNMVYSGTNAEPTAWTINGTSIDLDSPCDQAHTFRLHYRKKLDLETDTTNWLLTNHPDVYLFGALVEGNALTKSIEKATLWKSRQDEAIQEISDVEIASQPALLSVDPGLRMSRGFNINSGDYS